MESVFKKGVGWTLIPHLEGGPTQLKFETPFQHWIVFANGIVFLTLTKKNSSNGCGA